MQKVSNPLTKSLHLKIRPNLDIDIEFGKTANFYNFYKSETFSLFFQLNEKLFVGIFLKLVCVSREK
jgi:hypothetical protein